MNIKQIITDYIMRSILTTKGDMVVRGDSVPEKLAAGIANKVLISQGAGAKPIWSWNIGQGDAVGDLSVRTSNNLSHIAAVAEGQVLKSRGVGAVPAWSKPSLSDLNFHIGNFSRSIGGDQAISGVGFTSKLVLFIAGDEVNTYSAISIGFDDGTTHVGVYSSVVAPHGGIIGVNSIMIYRSVVNNLFGHISAIGGDGFTIAWTLNGAVILNGHYLAIG